MEDIITPAILSIKSFVSGDTIKSSTTQIRVYKHKVFYNNNFIGRKNELERLASLLHECGKVFVHGIGGIGKTELVKAFIVKNRNQYENVIYLSYEHNLQEMFINDYILKIDGISRQNDYTSVAESDEAYFHRKLFKLQELTDSKSLLIIDNYDTTYDPNLEEVLSGDYTIIITTRIDYSFLGIPVLVIDEMEQINDQIDLFSIHYKKDISINDKVALIEILKELHGHTLAIELVAKLMRIQAIDFEEMLKILRNNGLSPEIEGNIPYGYEQATSIYGTIQKVFRLNSLNENEIQTLMYLTLIPLAGFEINGFSKMCGFDSDDVVCNLIKKSWVIINNNYVSLHPLIAEVVEQETKINIKKIDVFLRNFTVAISNVWDKLNVEKNMYSALALKIYHLFPSVNSDYLSLYQGIANLLMLTEHLDTSNYLFNKCLQCSQEKYGEKSKETAELYCNLADNALSINDIPQSMFYIQKSIDIMKMIAPCELRTAYYIKFKIWLLYAEYKEEHKKEISKLLKECENILTKISDSAHSQIASLNTAYAYYYYYCNDMEKAIEFADIAYEQMLSIYGEIHADTLSPLGIKALILSKMHGRYNDAIELMNYVINTQKKIFSPHHKKILLRYERLALIYYNVGMLSDAVITLKNVCDELEKKEMQANSFYIRAKKQLEIWENELNAN